MKKRTIFNVIIVIFALFVSNVTSALAMPPIPATYYGVVMVEGELAPPGIRVVALINGIEYDAIVLDSASGPNYALTVRGDDPEFAGIDGGVYGDTIFFTINGHTAEQTAIWQSGSLENIDLSYIPNHLPTATHNTVTILEDAQKVFSVNDFNFSDADIADSLSQVKISTLESNGALYLDANGNGGIDSGEDIALNQVIPSTNIPKLKFKPDNNTFGSPYATFNFKVHDAKDYSLEAYQMTINVTPINDVPSFVKGANQSVDEDSGQQTVLNWATNISSGLGDESVQTLAFELASNTNPGLFSSAPAVNAVTGTLTYTPANNANGLATIGFRLRDNGGTTNGGVDVSATQSFTITVNALNDQPVAYPQSVSTLEDNAKSISLIGADVETPTLTFTILTQPAHGTLSGTPPSVLYTPALNYSGPDSFAFKVNDGAINSLPAEIAINVTAQNDAPTCQNLSLLIITNQAGQVLPDCADVDGDALAYEIVSQAAHGVAAISGGNIEYQPASNFTGSDSFTFHASDQTLNSNTTHVSITVLSPYPSVISILRADPNPTPLATVRFTVTFSSPVTNIGLDDFSLAFSGSINPLLSSINGSGNVYTVTVTTGGPIGVLGLNLVDNNSIIDQLGHTLGGPELGDGNFTGQSYNIVKTIRATFTSQGTQDGWILESSETSGRGGSLNATDTTFYVGDNASKKQYRGVLSFSTGATLPDNAVITKVTIKIKKQGISGSGNPFTLLQGMMVDIKQGYLGSSSSLVIGDFQSVANQTYGPFNPPLVGGWYSFDISGGGAYVNKLAGGSGLTQIRLRFKLDDNNNGVANYLKFYSGNYSTASYRPQLIVEYYVP